MMRAFEFLARDWAGMTLTISNGEWAWLGTFQQWQQVERLEAEIINGV